jgi:predicted amidohydrolase YtcJ
MKNCFLLSLLFWAVLAEASVKRKPEADILYYNAKVYTLNQSFVQVSAFLVTGGKIAETGDATALRAKYEIKKEVDLRGKFVYPGFIDAHSHFLGLGEVQFVVDLTGTKSWDEVIQRCKVFYDRNRGVKCIKGRGWDQNSWPGAQYPVNDELNRLFGNTPILLKRIDGHAAIVNDVVLQRAGYTTATTVNGGDLIKQKGRLTGVLIDNAVDVVESNPAIFPQKEFDELQKEQDTSEKICLSKGLTSVCDAGISSLQAEFLRQSQHKIRIYAMLSVNNENLDQYLDHPYKSDILNITSYKLYADGSLGSRGACLLQPYSDQPGHYGFLLTPQEQMEEYMHRIANSSYQLNTHCIGDSANRLIIGLYSKYLTPGNNRRWRIEHAQVVNRNDYHTMEQYGIIPSVQPVHATSDMGWALKRLGEERIKDAYSYRSLMERNRFIALGTDFPVELPDPLHTFYAAVSRKDKNGKPAGGFLPEQALTREEALKGITIWAAMAAFEEAEKGSIEPGKFADFVVLDVDLMKDDLMKIRNAKIVATYINGECVFGGN